LVAALNNNPDYLYLQTLIGSGNHEQTLNFLSEVRSRISQGTLGKSTFYTVRLLEWLVGTGVINPIYENRKVINDFPDLRAEASLLLGLVGSADSRWALIHVVGAETDPYALSAEVQALGALSFDVDGASARAISAAFSRAGISPPNNRLATATVVALDNIASHMGALGPFASETLFSIFHGAYFDEIRASALAALQRQRGP
jgi:hypothetical protein